MFQRTALCYSAPSVRSLSGKSPAFVRFLAHEKFRRRRHKIRPLDLTRFKRPPGHGRGTPLGRIRSVSIRGAAPRGAQSPGTVPRRRAAGVSAAQARPPVATTGPARGGRPARSERPCAALPEALWGMCICSLSSWWQGAASRPAPRGEASWPQAPCKAWEEAHAVSIERMTRR